MRNSGERFITDNDMICSEFFTDMCRGDRANVFVRNRKMPVNDLVFSMINRNEYSGAVSRTCPG